MVGFARGRVPVVEPDVLASGLTHYENAVVTGRVDSRVEGMALDVTDAELIAADGYEAPADYVRIAVTLASGARAVGPSSVCRATSRCSARPTG